MKNCRDRKRSDTERSNQSDARSSSGLETTERYSHDQRERTKQRQRRRITTKKYQRDYPGKPIEQTRKQAFALLAIQTH